MSNNKIYEDYMFCAFNMPDEDDDDKSDKKTDKKVVDKKTQDTVKSILQNGLRGAISTEGDFDAEVTFCVLGLAPNAGRISVRYFYKDSFGRFCDRIKSHYDDIAILGAKTFVGIGSILYATVSSKSKDKDVNPLLGGAVTRAILTGEMYPQILLNQTIVRVKTEAMVTQARAAIIKGFLVRKSRILYKKEEKITMALNEQSTNEAYVLGRTFAILEMIQKKALGDINSTIKDKYFASACANPALVFPNLLKLAQHHLAKIESNYLNNILGQCLSLIEGEFFPKTMSMENQGRFILGYYQQNRYLYTAKPKAEKIENVEEDI